MHSSSRCLAAGAALACLSLTIADAHADEVRSIDIRRPVSLAGAERTYWLASGASEAEALSLREALVAAGARNVNLFVPDMVIVCDVPPAVAGEVQAAGNQAVFRPRSAKSLRTLAAASSSGWIEESYALAERVARGDGAEALASDANDPDAFRDVVMTISPQRVDEIQRMIDDARARDVTGTRPPIARRINQNSEFLGGYILANFVYPESNGTRDPNFENWSDEDLRQAKAGATAAFLSWQGKFPNMDIGFVIHHFERIATGYEPITHDMATDGRWISDAMSSMGWSGDESHAVVHEFNESERAKWRTQWVVTSFIASSRNTPGNRFKSGTAPYTAYAFLGGPYMIEPFPAGSDPNGIGETLVYSQIVNHEIGHLFYALDEYPGAPGVCSTRSGYLDMENGNVTMTDPGGEQARCIPHIPCIMHTAARTNQNRPWCDYSQGQIGVLDGNGNAIPDIFEAEPEVTFVPEGIETVTTDTYTLRVKARATAVPNMNPNQGNDRVSYTLPLDDGDVVFGTFRIGLQPLDGRWDEIEEDCEFELQIPSAGQIVTLVVQVENEAGFHSQRVSKSFYVARLNYDRLVAVAKWNRIELSWETPGQTFGAKFNVYRLKQGESMPGTLLAQNVAPSRIGPLGQPMFLVQDFDITVGGDYRYYIQGVFELPSGAGTREFVSQSAVVAQTAMVPVTDVVSEMAPNPTRDTVTFSVTVPKTFNETSQGPTRVPTDVDIRVFNVRGQLVRTLKASSELNTVVTMRWDGTAQDGTQVPSGIYFLRVQAGELDAVRKIVLLR